MKLKRNLILVVAAMLFAGAANAQQFGHVNATLVLAMTPEYKEAMKTLTTLDSTYSVELEKMVVEINKKIEEFEKDATLPASIMDVKRKEIEQMQVNANAFQQTIQGELQQQQQQLIAPISQKIVGAIQEIAKEKKLVYVFDVSQGNPIYTSDDSVDLVPLLFEKFGIEYDPAALQQQGMMPQ